MTDFDAAVPRSRSLGRDALVLAVGMAVANAGNYGFNLVMAFLLGPEAYGALAALLALVLVVVALVAGWTALVHRGTKRALSAGLAVAALAAGRLRRVLTETSASAVRGTRALTRTLAVVPEPLQLPSSPDRTRPSAQTLTSAATSWALAAPALRASRPPPSAAAPSTRFIHTFTWSSPW